MSDPHASAFKPATLKVRIEDPEEGEVFLAGLVLAMTNNNSSLFPELIDGVNSILQPWREARLLSEVEARKAAGMP